MPPRGRATRPRRDPGPGGSLDCDRLHRLSKGASAMQLQVKAQHGSVPDSVHAYTEKRLSKLSRRLYEGTLVEVTFARERNPSIAADHVAEGVVQTKGSNLVAREAAATYEAAVDR